MISEKRMLGGKSTHTSSNVAARVWTRVHWNALDRLLHFARAAFQARSCSNAQSFRGDGWHPRKLCLSTHDSRFQIRSHIFIGCNLAMSCSKRDVSNAKNVNIDATLHSHTHSHRIWETMIRPPSKTWQPGWNVIGQSIGLKYP